MVVIIRVVITVWLALVTFVDYTNAVSTSLDLKPVDELRINMLRVVVQRG